MKTESGDDSAGLRPPRVVFAPGGFGSMSPIRAAEAMRDGWLAAFPYVEAIVRPISDGGPGFGETVVAAFAMGAAKADERAGGAQCSGQPSGAIERGIAPGLTMCETADGLIAVIDSAVALDGDDERGGPRLLSPHRDDHEDPAVVSGRISGGSGPVGRAVAEAVERRASQIYIGAGSVLANDGGAGMIEAVHGLDLAQCHVTVAAGCAEALTGVDSVYRARLAGVGASEQAARLAHIEAKAASDRVRLLAGAYPDATRLARHPYMGAGGGIAFAAALLGATVLPGEDVCADLTGLAAALDGADLVVTGERTLSIWTLSGGAVMKVGQLARDRGIPAIALAGEAHINRPELADLGLLAAYSVAGDSFLPTPWESAASDVERLSRRISSTWTARPA